MCYVNPRGQKFFLNYVNKSICFFFLSKFKSNKIVRDEIPPIQTTNQISKKYNKPNNKINVYLQQHFNTPSMILPTRLRFVVSNIHNITFVKIVYNTKMR